MGSIYCLYSTRDGAPRYVGKTLRWPETERLREHHVSAERGKLSLHLWIRGEWLAGHDVKMHTIRFGIPPEDMNLSEKIWMGKFSNLQNERCQFWHGYYESNWFHAARSVGIENTIGHPI